MITDKMTLILSYALCIPFLYALNFTFHYLLPSPLHVALFACFLLPFSPPTPSLLLHLPPPTPSSSYTFSPPTPSSSYAFPPPTPSPSYAFPPPTPSLPPSMFYITPHCLPLPVYFSQAHSMCCSVLSHCASIFRLEIRQ